MCKLGIFVVQLELQPTLFLPCCFEVSSPSDDSATVRSSLFLLWVDAGCWVLDSMKRIYKCEIFIVKKIISMCYIGINT